MSNFVQDFEEDDDHFSSSTRLLQPSPENDHPTKKKRNLPGNPGFVFFAFSYIAISNIYLIKLICKLKEYYIITS